MTEPTDAHRSEREKTLIRQLEDAQREARDNQWAIEEITHRLQDSLKRGGQREKRLVEALREIDCLGDSCHVSRLQEVARQTLTELGYDPD